MNRAWMVLFLPLAAACSETPTQPSASLTVPAPSMAVIASQTTDLTGQYLDVGGCGIADPLLITRGTEWFQTNQTITPQRWNVSIHYGFEGVEAVSSAGENYQIPVMQTLQANTDLTGSTGEATTSAQAKIIGAGTATDANVTEVAHVTVDPNGNLVIEVEHITLTCK